MSTIASLLVTIGADVSALERGLRDTETQIDSFASRASQGVKDIGAEFIRAGAAIDTIGAPLRQVGQFGLDTAANFEAAMAEISARTGIVGADLKQIGDFAIQMGADTAFSAQQSADAFLQLLSSGQSAEEAVSTLPFILDAAAASGEDLGRTADVITDIMASFGLEVSEAGNVVDALAQAAGASSADMSSLGQGFANVGGVAKNFGLDVEDTAAILAIFAENGIKGAEAGTNLKSVLLNMSRDTKDTKAAWEALGLSLYDAEGNVRDFETVIGELDFALDQLPAEEQNKLMKDLAGSYGILGLTALRGSISISQMRDNMLKQAGAHEVAQARMATFQGTVDSLKGSFEALMIVALTPLMENFLTPLADQFIDITNGVTMWASENPELTSTLVAIGGAIAIAGPALIAFGTAITLAAPAVGVLAGGLGILGGAIALVLSPIGLVAAAIAGLIYVASQLIDFTALADTIETGFNAAIGAISDVDVTALRDAITTAINGITIDTSQLTTFADNAKTTVSDAIAGVSSAGASIDLTTLQTGITDSFTSMDFTGVATVMDTHFNDIMSAIVSIAGIVFGGPVGMAIGAASLVGKAIETDFLGIGTFLETSGISGAVTDALASVKTTIDSVIQSIFGGAQQGPQASPLDITGALLPDQPGGLSGPLGTFVSDLQAGFAALQEIAANVWSNIGPGLTDLGEGITGFIENLSGAETDGLLRVVTVVVGAIGGLVGKVVEFGSEIVGEVLSSVGAALPSIGAALSGFITALSDIGEGNWSEVLPDLGQAFIDIGQAILNFMGIDLQIPSFDEAIAGWQTFADSLEPIITVVLDGIAVGFRQFANGLEETISRLQLAFTDLQIALGINYDANVAFKDNELVPRINALETVRILQEQLAASMAAGDASIDLSQWTTVDPAAIAAKISDPTLIQEALNTALAEGDQATFDVLAPIAMELGINPEDLVTQYQTAITNAAASTEFTAQVQAKIYVHAASIDFSAVSGTVSGGIAAAANAAGGQIAVPALASGGYVNSGGVAVIHPGEAIIPADVTRNMNLGNGGGGSPTINIQTNDADQLIHDLKRQGIDLYAMANAA